MLSEVFFELHSGLTREGPGGDRLNKTAVGVAGLQRSEPPES